MPSPSPDSYSALPGVSIVTGSASLNSNNLFGGATIDGTTASGGLAAIVSPTVSPGIPGAVSLVSASTQNAPFSFGAAFKKGDISSGSGIAVSGASGQAAIKSTWSDGSVKFAIISGNVSLSAGVPKAITMSAGSASTGTLLTTSDLATALSDVVSVAAGAFGSAVFGNTEWASPFKVIVAGHQMSSWVFRKQIGTDAHLVAWLEVRLFLGGAVEILPWVENGYSLVSGPTQKSATYTFTMGGTLRFSSDIDLLHHQRTPLISGTELTYWLGTNPSLTVIHDTDYLQETGLVPCYTAKTPQTAATIAEQATSFTPLSNSNFYAGNAMSGGGNPAHIGLLPQWEVLHLTGPSAKTYKSIQINGYGMGRYPIHYRDENDSNRWARLSNHPTTQFGRQPEGGYDTTPATSGTAPPGWDFAHQPSVCVVAYLITGSQYFLDEVQAAASYNSLGITNGDRSSGEGIFRSNRNGNTRHVAWCWRNLALAIALTPDAETTVLTEFRGQMARNAAEYKSKYVTFNNSVNAVRFVEDVDYNQSGPDGIHAGSPWMQDYLTAAIGYAMDMDMQLPSTGNSDLSEFFHWHAPSIVGRFGAAGGGGWNYRDYGPYALITAPSDTPNYTDGSGPWYTTWGQAYAARYNSSGLAYTDVVPGPDTDGPIRNWYIGDSQATAAIGALAYCVKHGATGAMAGYQRLTSAANWYSIIADFDLQPQWGVTWHPTPKWARGMEVMEWKQIGLGSRMMPTAPNTVLAKLTDGSTAVGGGNSYGARLDAYCGVGTDVRYSKLFTLAAGGHGDYYNNEIVQISLLDNDPTWVVSYNGSSGNVINTPSDFLPRYTDNHPASAHTYYGLQTMERHGRWLRLGGSLSPSGNGDTSTQSWNASTTPGANGWDAANVYENYITSGIESAICKDPTTEKLYAFNGSKLYRGTPTISGPNGAANSGMTMGWYAGSLDAHEVALNNGAEGATAVDFTRNKLLWTHGFGQPSNEARIFTLTEPAPTYFKCSAYAGAAGTELTAKWSSGVGMVYEPRLDAYLMRFFDAGSSVFAIDAASAAAGTPNVIKLTTTGGSTIEQQSGSGYNGVFNKFTRLPALRGVVYISGMSNQIWFLRLY